MSRLHNHYNEFFNSINQEPPSWGFLRYYWVCINIIQDEIDEYKRNLSLVDRLALIIDPERLKILKRLEKSKESTSTVFKDRLNAAVSGVPFVMKRDEDVAKRLKEMREEDA